MDEVRGREGTGHAVGRDAQPGCGGSGGDEARGRGEQGGLQPGHWPPWARQVGLVGDDLRLVELRPRGAGGPHALALQR